jgi:hypothetical protein
MLMHMEDKGEFDMFIDDSGNLLVTCPQCPKVWTGKLTLAESEKSVREVRSMVNTARRINPSLLQDIGMDAKTREYLQL